MPQGKSPEPIVIEKLYGGWAYDLSSSNSAAVEGNPGEYSKSASICNFRPGFEGHISPGFTFDTVTDANARVNGWGLNADVDSTGTAFVILDSGRVVYFDVTQNSIGNNYHDITGTATVTATNGDLINAYSLTGTPPSATTEEYVFYSYEHNTAGDVGRRVRSTGVWNDTYLSSLGTQSNGTGLYKGFPHPLAIGLLDKLIIGNGRYVTMHDPTTSTVDYQAFDLKPGFIVTSLVRYQNYNAIAGYRGNTNALGQTKGESAVFFWDGSAPSYDAVYPIRDYKVTALFMDGTDLYAFSFGRNSSVKLWKFNGSGFDLIKESRQIGSAPGKGGADLFYNHLVWGDPSGGRLLAYGPLPEGGLHSSSAASGIGMARTLYQNTLYISDNSSGTYTLMSSNFSNYAVGATLRSQLYTLPLNSTITAIKVYFSNFGTGASVTLSLFKDYNLTVVGGTNDLLNYTITNSTDGAISYFAIPNGSLPIEAVNAFYLFLTFNHASATNSAAIIRKIEVEYQVDTEQI